MINSPSLMEQKVNNFSDFILSFYFFQGNVPFRRVKSDEVLINRKLSDNSFEAKVYHTYFLAFQLLLLLHYFLFRTNFHGFLLLSKSLMKQVYVLRNMKTVCVGIELMPMCLKFQIHDRDFAFYKIHKT